jgi:hypothetical protein
MKTYGAAADGDEWSPSHGGEEKNLYCYQESNPSSPAHRLVTILTKIL